MILLKFDVNANIIKPQIFHNMKFDLKDIETRSLFNFVKRICDFSPVMKKI